MGFYIEAESWTLDCQVKNGDSKPYTAIVFYRGAYVPVSGKDIINITDKHMKNFKTEEEARNWIQQEFEKDMNK